MSLKSYRKIIEMQQERDRSEAGSPRASRERDHDRYRPQGYESESDYELPDDEYYEEVEVRRRPRRPVREPRRPAREYDYDYDDYYDRRDRYPYERRRRGMGCGAWFLIIVVAVLVIAAITNPSQSEARRLIKDTTLEYTDAYIREKAEQEADGALGAFASMLGRAIAPQVYDYAIDTRIDNFIFFSKFDMSVRMEMIGINQKVVSGIIVFGQVIPLETNVPDFKK